MRVANRGQPHSTKLTQSAHHVKDHAGLSCLTEVQAVPHNNIETIVRRQSTIEGRLNVIAGNKKLCFPLGAVKIAASGSYLPSVRNCRVKKG